MTCDHLIWPLQIKNSENFKKEKKMKVNNSSHRLINATADFILFFILALCMLGIFDQPVQAASKVRIIEGDEWHYFKGKTKPPRRWNHIGFDHSHWHKGPTGLGYGRPNLRTVLGDMQGNYLSVYARREFTIAKPAAVTGINLSVVCDGPFIAHINGIEVIRTNTIQMSTPGQAIGSPLAEQLDISGFAHELLPGSNVLTIECNNDDIDSNDFYFIPFFEVLGK